MSTPTTEMGKELRKIRIDRDERLLNMAQKLGVSSSFISAIEVGRKTAPVGFEQLIIEKYRLTGEEKQRLLRAADQSRHEFTIGAKSPLARDTAGLLARKMDSLSEEQLRAILSVVGKAK